MSEVEEELRWAREALAIQQNHNFSYQDAHKARFPNRYQHFLTQSWDKTRLQEHVDRLERDLESNWFIGSDVEDN